jgi:hypothetical protein
MLLIRHHTPMVAAELNIKKIIEEPTGIAIAQQNR